MAAYFVLAFCGRTMSRTLFKRQLPQPGKICGYSKHPLEEGRKEIYSSLAASKADRME